MNNPTLQDPTLPPQDEAVSDATTDAHTALTRREGTTVLTAFARLADIPEEDLWLQNQRSAHTRRAYKEMAN